MFRKVLRYNNLIPFSQQTCRGRWGHPPRLTAGVGVFTNPLTKRHCTTIIKKSSFLFMIKRAIILSVFLSCWAFSFAQTIVFVDELNLSHSEQDDYPIMAGKNVKGNAIKLNHTIYTRGIGTYTNSMLHINLHKGALKFNAIVGFDDEVLGQGCHPIEFIVYADDTIAWQSGIMLPADASKNIDIDIKGVSMLSLYVKSVRGKWNGYSAWANARFEVAGARPETFIREKEADRSPLASAGSLHGR